MLIAAAVIIVWGCTFISSKFLLDYLRPAEIMFYRFIIAYVAIILIDRKFTPPRSWRDELKFAAAGIFGVTLYFLTENYALLYSTASNVGLLVSTAPLLTAVLSHFFLKGEKFRLIFIIGAAVAMAGVFLVIFNGSFVLGISPLGDALAIGSALSWAIYSIFMKKLGDNYSAATITRRTFFYALISFIPFVIFGEIRIFPPDILLPAVWLNLLFLGIIASAIGYFVWAFAISKLGAVRTNNLIYFIPLVTVVVAWIVLGEELSLFAIIGAVLIMAGVYVSSLKSRKIVPDTVAEQQGTPDIEKQNNLVN